MTPDPAAPVGLNEATMEPMDRLWSCGCGWSFFTDDPVQGAAEKVEHHTSGEHLDNQLEIQRRSQAAAPVGLDLDRIRELLAKATPGPWSVEEAEWIWADGRLGGWVSTDTSAADAALIVALRNQAGALLDLVSRQAAEIAQLEASLIDYSAPDHETSRILADAAEARSLLPREPKIEP